MVAPSNAAHASHPVRSPAARCSRSSSAIPRSIDSDRPPVRDALAIFPDSGLKDALLEAVEFCVARVY